MKRVKIEYVCERCGSVEIRERKPVMGIVLVGRYPQAFTTINKYHLCSKCAAEHEQRFDQWMTQPLKKARTAKTN